MEPHIGVMPLCWSPGHAGHGWWEAIPPIAGCICAAIATLDANGPRPPIPKARTTARTRKRLMSEPSMPVQHTTRRRSCQGTGARLSSALGRGISTLLLLLALGVTPAIPGEIPNTRQDSLRTDDHLHVSAQRAGDTILVILRIDPGYQSGIERLSDPDQHRI